MSSRAPQETPIDHPGYGASQMRVYGVVVERQESCRWCHIAHRDREALSTLRQKSQVAQRSVDSARLTDCGAVKLEGHRC